MKLVIIEPLGVEKEKLLAIAREYVSAQVEIIYYDTKVTDTASLIERGKDADIIVVSNLPMNGEVIRGCEKLKLLSVAFTGVDHIDLQACRKKGYCGVQLRRIFHGCGCRSGVWHADRPVQESDPL